MSDDAEESNEDEGGGIPAWVMTFADLMSLLMCFFVLLLSFSEMDVIKYKQLAGAMKNAFGVQRIVKDNEIPKGTSVIMQQFSPGTPQPTPIDRVQQVTSEEKQHLDTECVPEKIQSKEDQAKEIKRREAEARNKAVKLMAALKDEIDKGSVQVETDGADVVIRVNEKGSFSSGSADLQPGFIPIMDVIREVLANTEGDIAVEGHTDDIPIETAQFESNWALSSGRAVAVAHELLVDERIDADRVKVMGLADTRPITDNETVENRAKNRRVEIIVQPPSKARKPPKSKRKNLFEAGPDGIRAADSEEGAAPGPELRPDEIF